MKSLFQQSGQTGQGFILRFDAGYPDRESWRYEHCRPQVSQDTDEKCTITWKLRCVSLNVRLAQFLTVGRSCCSNGWIISEVSNEGVWHLLSARSWGGGVNAR